MKHLRKFNEMVSSNTKDILRKGFRSLIMRSHIVNQQVENNMDKFIDSLDIERFEMKFGKIVEFLGAGVFGAVFSLDNGKVFKITFDYHEAPFLYEYCMLNKTRGFVKVDGVWKIPFGDTEAYLILRSPVDVLEYSDFSKYDVEVKEQQTLCMISVQTGEEPIMVIMLFKMVKLFYMMGFARKLQLMEQRFLYWNYKLVTLYHK